MPPRKEVLIMAPKTPNKPKGGPKGGGKGK